MWLIALLLIYCWLVTRVMLPKAEVPTKPLRERFDLPVTESVPKADVA
jgi:hypothetical protein